jgi:hypothetical protein
MPRFCASRAISRIIRLRTASSDRLRAFAGVERAAVIVTNANALRHCRRVQGAGRFTMHASDVDVNCGAPVAASSGARGVHFVNDDDGATAAHLGLANVVVAVVAH